MIFPSILFKGITPNLRLSRGCRRQKNSEQRTRNPEFLSARRRHTHTARQSRPARYCYSIVKEQQLSQGRLYGKNTTFPDRYQLKSSQSAHQSPGRRWTFWSKQEPQFWSSYSFLCVHGHFSFKKEPYCCFLRRVTAALHRRHVIVSLDFRVTYNTGRYRVRTYDLTGVIRAL